MLKNLRREIDGAVENCDVFRLSYLLGDTDEARGATNVLSSYIWRTAYKGRDKFIEKCECKRK